MSEKVTITPFGWEDLKDENPAEFKYYFYHAKDPLGKERSGLMYLSHDATPKDALKAIMDEFDTPIFFYQFYRVF